MASVSFSELSLGRTASAKKAASRVASAVTSFRPRIPLTLRGVRVKLRTPPPPLPPNRQTQPEQRPVLRPSPSAAPKPVRQQPTGDACRGRSDSAGVPGADAKPQSNAKLLQALAAARGAAARAANAWEWLSEHAPVHLPLRLVADAALQLLITLLPSVPVRVKDIQVSFEVWRVLPARYHRVYSAALPLLVSPSRSLQRDNAGAHARSCGCPTPKLCCAGGEAAAGGRAGGTAAAQLQQVHAARI